MFFYELHEGDDDVYSDALVVSESEWEPQEFFELVQSIRRRVQDQYHHETLVEAIAIELERDHGFVYVSDDQLTACGEEPRISRVSLSSDPCQADRGRLVRQYLCHRFCVQSRAARRAGRTGLLGLVVRYLFLVRLYFFRGQFGPWQAYAASAGLLRGC